MGPSSLTSIPFINTTNITNPFISVIRLDFILPLSTTHRLHNFRLTLQIHAYISSNGIVRHKDRRVGFMVTREHGSQHC